MTHKNARGLVGIDLGISCITYALGSAEPPNLHGVDVQQSHHFEEMQEMGSGELYMRCLRRTARAEQKLVQTVTLLVQELLCPTAQHSQTKMYAQCEIEEG